MKTDNNFNQVLFYYNKNFKHTGPNTWAKNLIDALESEKSVRVVTASGFKYLFLLNTFNVLHIYKAAPFELLGGLYFKLFRKGKIIFTLHGDIYKELENKIGLKKLLWIPMHEFCLKIADHITFPSEFLYKIIIDKFPQYKGKSSIIFNGIDLDKVANVTAVDRELLGLDNDDLILLQISSFNLKEKIRGLDLLISEFIKSSKLNEKLQLVVIGSGIHLDEYKEKYKAFHKIKFLGYIPNALNYIQACDLFMHYSFLDNLPYVILEALALHKPVQALATGGIPEILPKEYLTDGDINLDLIKSPLNLDLSIIDVKLIKGKFCRLYLDA